MARSEARITLEIWDDDDFIALDRGEQGTYFFLLSQRDLTQVGVLPLRERRWTRKAGGLTEEAVREHVKALEHGRFVITDEDTGELLIRSYIRRDKVYRQPNVLQAALGHLDLIESPRILAVLAEELRRVAMADDIPEGSVPVLETMLETLGVTDVVPRAESNRKGTGKGSRKGSEKGSEKGTGKGSEKGSRKSSESPTQMGTSNPRAKDHGERGDVTAVSTDSPSPIPLSPIPNPSSEADAVEPVDGSEPGQADDPPDPEPRVDVDHVCRHLADRIEANGSKRPTITRRWREAARLMIDRDERTAEQIVKAIDWCQDDEFWRANILSMPTLREKFDQLRLAAQRGNARASPPQAGHRPYRNPETVEAYRGEL